MLDGAESIMAFQVRAERLKEKHPDSIDALNRITKELLLTITSCSSAILRASMTSEAAKLLNLPEVALREELSKMKSEVALPPSPPPRPSADVNTPPLPGEDAASVVPPPSKELAFCEFLLANEYDENAKMLEGKIGEFLPRFVFVHDFTWKFIETWRTEIVKGGDLIAPWSDALSPHERKWFDLLLVGQSKALESTLENSDILEDFVRSLWIDCLKRLRGSLAASGDADATARRMKITLDLKRLNAVKWSSVKEIIRDWIENLK